MAEVHARLHRPSLERELPNAPVADVEYDARVRAVSSDP
jgi:hypothetical protein